MASINDKAATSALNEEEYINKLYDTNLQNQNQLLQDNQNANNAVLDEAQKLNREQTGDYVTRTEVEAGKAAELYGYGGVSSPAQVQNDLTRENAQRKNVNTLRQAQNDADLEFERQRKLLASQFESEIRQAQANNDMERAQALYEAAKEKEAQLLELQKQGAALMESKGSSAGYEAIAAGQGIAGDPNGESWEEALRNEDALNRIYDAQLEGQREQLRYQQEQALSDLEAQSREQQKQMDEALTQAYVDALRDQQGNAEYRNAQGQASGTVAQTRLAEDIQLQDTLTELRKHQLEADAGFGGAKLEIGREQGEAMRKAQQQIDSQRAQALFGAARDEEQALIERQLLAGQLAAERGDYSILGMLYGLTPEQIAALTPQATGGYVPPATDDNTGTGNGDSWGTVSGPSLLPEGYVGTSVPEAYNALLELLKNNNGSGMPNR